MRIREMGVHLIDMVAGQITGGARRSTTPATGEITGAIMMMTVRVITNGRDRGRRGRMGGGPDHREDAIINGLDRHEEGTIGGQGRRGVHGGESIGGTRDHRREVRGGQMNIATQKMR